MKSLQSMSLEQLATYIATHLENNNIPVVLVGGACVSIYTHNKYQTSDLDFIERYHTKRTDLKKVLGAIGFTEKNRYFIHPDCHYFLEFPAGPISVGDEPVKQLNEKTSKEGLLKLLTPTDCIKDRLAAFYHWNDMQSLQQALWVAAAAPFNMSNIKNWSKKEGMLVKFKQFEKRYKDGH
jgi:hypothetical protein